ncbi:MAG: DUF4831 family protein [Prevotella sp.]|nr:DUF4831 family protein [Prevotella sp.]
MSAQTRLSQYRHGVTSEGAVYFLPKTALRFTVQVEKTSYSPGEYAKYADLYLGLHDVNTQPDVSYRVTHIDMTPFGVVDTTKCYAVEFNAKTSACNIQLSDDGVLLAINASAPQPVASPKVFVPIQKPKPMNTRQYLSEEILTAGSHAKRAELIAQEIYNIRESKNLLTRGEADFMPKDGEQLRIMLNQLDIQQNALMQFFTGTTTVDTTEHVFELCPTEEISRTVLFRLSQKLGFTDADDLSGAPYYITVEDLHATPAAAPVEEKKKKKKEDGIYINVPGRIRVCVSQGNDMIYKAETPAAQFGFTELLSGELFNKRYTTHVWMNPATGALEKLEAEQPE